MQQILNWYRADDGLRRKITLLLVVKVCFLTLMWWAFFSPAHRIEVDGPALRAHLLGD